MHLRTASVSLSLRNLFNLSHSCVAVASFDYAASGEARSKEYECRHGKVKAGWVTK